ncbi:hypothetical protein N7466_001732 [Penicillium verhagenii]|uniref:uncharacterized protein n=1 Tax=Penicillium verhagenii TaxID=1562060 RepID=UPI002544EC93|nr:uncharacterized protein N7466_001732 [Penicillium verhagenii]KAJ5938598.1 hypothetical protein N7466_001732 [Penicillium verhagenii]
MQRLHPLAKLCQRSYGSKLTSVANSQLEMPGFNVPLNLPPAKERKKANEFQASGWVGNSMEERIWECFGPSLLSGVSIDGSTRSCQTPGLTDL